MTKTWHKRTAVASMFQNGISRNTKCAERDSFYREGHNYVYISKFHTNDSYIQLQLLAKGFHIEIMLVHHNIQIKPT